MILSCNSCEKKFVVPDNAIGATGRLVQCSSCGNKWTQFPINKTAKPKEEISKIKIKTPIKITQNLVKKPKRKIKKKTGPDLYSPEYLAKKHGIKIGEQAKLNTKTKKIEKSKTEISLGFYNLFLVYIVIIIFVLRLVYFGQDIIIENFPITQVYIDYLFETITNIKDIIQNFFSNY